MRVLHWLSAASLGAAGLLPAPATPPHPTIMTTPTPAHGRASSVVDSTMLAGLVWRNVGPFRGGRISAVSGVVGQPGVFYAGTPGGGVWKTTSAGETWFPVFDAVRSVSSIGAVAVAPSDPNVVYAGTGDMVTGGAINEGDGVYRSSDAGRTWHHVGLEATKQIPSILVGPSDPNLVLVAAQGDLHRKSADRGVFRSTDGGATWTRTLAVDDTVGVERLAAAYDVPTVVFATTVRHYVAPGATSPAAAPDTGRTTTRLYRSDDAGATWREISGGGLPRLAGRTAVAVAMHTGARRVYLIGGFGLYRSDDGGATWRRVAADDKRIMTGQGGYNCGVYVDPQNPDVVYTINTSSYVSRDGGNTFTGFKGAPGGDDPQQMWIDPTDGRRILLGLDQGAVVSLDGGATWSSWYNQSTEQVYHLATDNSFPYWIYATQQDAGAVATRSRGNLGAITPLDWKPVPGWEWGTVVPDPLDANVVYASGMGILKITSPAEQWINVSPAADPAMKARTSLSQPLVWAPWNRHELLAGLQVVVATTDGGAHWTTLSPDLTQPTAATTAAAAAVTATRARAAGAGSAARVARDTMRDTMRDTARAPATPGPTPRPTTTTPPATGAIESLAASRAAAGTIWAGTTNGHVAVTRDHGKTWTDVSVPGLPDAEHADVSSVEASPRDAATAYVAIDLHRVGDYAPYVFRTRDYGKTWTRIVDGLPTGQPAGSFARVVRADPERAGLLFAGTESGVYVSFDDGDHWRSLQLNLPTTSFRDMTIHGNDLVVGTYGRGIWVLDDVSPLRQLAAPATAASIASEPVHLFAPGAAVRVRRNVNADTPFPPEVPHALNPPDGVIVYYALAAAPRGPITLDVTDAAGRRVRHYSSAPIAPVAEAARPPEPSFWLATPEPLPTRVGLNRFAWDLRYDAPPAFHHSFEINANPGLTPASPEGPLALPGVYSITLIVDGKIYGTTATVRPDPRPPVATAAALRAQHALQMQLDAGLRAAWDGYQRAAALRDAVAKATAGATDADVVAAAAAIAAKLDTVAGSPEGRGGPRAARGGPTPPPNFVAVSDALVRELEAQDNGDLAPTPATLAARDAVCRDLRSAAASLRRVETSDLATLNAVLARHGVPAVPAAKGAAPAGC